MSVMRSRDVVAGHEAQCFVTIGENRYNLMTLKSFEGSIENSNGEVKRLGARMVGHKPGISKGSWTAKGYYGTPMLRKVLYDYKNTGVFPEIDIQVMNEDPASKVGRQTVIFKQCLIDKGILAMFDVDSEQLEEDISGTYDDYELPEQFSMLDGMQ